jgi:hypothetical protein
VNYLVNKSNLEVSLVAVLGETEESNSRSESCFSMPSSSSLRVNGTLDGRSSCLGSTGRVRGFAVCNVMLVRLYPSRIVPWRLLACVRVSWKVSVAMGVGTINAFLAVG